MKKFLFFCVASILLLLSSCSKNDYANAIPKEAVAVMSLNCNNLVDKAGIKSSDLVKEIKNNESEMDKDFVDFILPLIEEPKEVGIDFRQKLYAYVHDNGMGVVLPVLDEEKLTNVLRKLAEKDKDLKLEKEGDYNYVITDNFLVVYNGTTLVGSNFYGDDKPFRQRLRNQIEQENEKSYASTEGFKRLEKSEEDFVVTIDLSNLPEAATKNVPVDVDLEDYSVMMSLNCEKGKLAAKFNLYSEKEKVQKELEEKMTKMISKVSGTYLPNVPENALGFIAQGIVGEDYLDTMMKQNPQLGMALTMANQIMPIMDIIKGINGDLSGFVTMANLEEEPQFLVMAHMPKGAEVFSDPSRWDVQELGASFNPANNEVAMEGIVMGTTGKELYVTNSEELKAKASTKSGNTKLNELAKEIKESYGYIWIDLPKAVKLVPVNNGNEGYLTMARMLTGLTKDLVMKLTSPLEFKVELRVNSEDNFLKFFIDTCKTFI